MCTLHDPTSKNPNCPFNNTGPSLNLIQRNVPQSNVTWPNKSNVVTNCLWQLIWGKKYRRYTWGRFCPTDSSSHFCPKNSVCHRQNIFTQRVFVMNINRRDGQSSRPRLQWTFPQKTASVPWMRESDCQGGHQGTPWTSSSWRVPPRLFRSHNASFLCEFTALCL